MTAADYTPVAIPTGGGVPDQGRPIFCWINTLLGNLANALCDT